MQVVVILVLWVYKRVAVILVLWVCILYSLLFSICSFSFAVQGSQNDIIILFLRRDINIRRAR